MYAIRSYYETFTTNKWSHSWLAQVSKQHNFVINDDMKKVNGVLDALNRKSGQCPCGGTGEQFKCPCTIMREHRITSYNVCYTKLLRLFVVNVSFIRLSDASLTVIL